VEEQASGAQAVVQAMERMRELVQSNTSGSTELAASSDQMSKMSRGLLDSMDRFELRSDNKTNGKTNGNMNDSAPGYKYSARTAAAGSQ
jgi:uncharacterized membrane protein YdfJ with MMPL/SSD domain